MTQGCIHLYWGDGKGKTTAAMGLALRALGRGKRVAVLLYLKDGDSGELRLLREAGAVVYTGKPEPAFAWDLTAEERAFLRRRQTELTRQAAESDAELLVLDEACAALQTGLVEESLLRSVVTDRPAGREIVLTGREPAPWMLEAADYCTEMRCIKHPYDRGQPAREGVEF